MDFAEFKADMLRRLDDFQKSSGDFPAPADAPSSGDREAYSQDDYEKSKRKLGEGSDYDKKKAFVAMARKKYSKES